MSSEVSAEKFSHSVEKDISRAERVVEAPPVIGFGVFYGDGSSYFGRTEEDWKKAPKEDVQVILLYYDKYDVEGNHYRHSVCGWDYYTFDGYTYMASNDTRNLCSDYILYGKWMDTDKWKQIAKNALEYHHNF